MKAKLTINGVVVELEDVTPDDVANIIARIPAREKPAPKAPAQPKRRTEPLPPPFLPDFFRPTTSPTPYIPPTQPYWDRTYPWDRTMAPQCLCGGTSTMVVCPLHSVTIC